MTTIQIKRNNSNAATKPSSLLVGELAGNLLDRSLFSYDGSSVFQFYTGTTKWFDTSGNANNANKLGGVAASSYATQAWVEGKKYLTAIPSEYVTETELSNTLGGYQTKITSSNKLAYSLISGTPTFATVATSGKYSDLSGLPTIPTNNNQLTNGAGYITSAALNGYATQNWVDSNFLSKSGGTMVSGAGVYSPLDLVYAAVAFNSDHNAFGSPNVPTKIRSSSNPVYTNGSVEYSLIHSGNYSSYALPLSGGTITGPLYIDSSSSSSQPLALRSNAADASGACRIQFIDANNAFQGYVMSGWGNLLLAHRSYNQIGVGDSGIWCSSDNGITKNTLIHSGNIGDQSVDAATRLQDSNGALVYNSGNTFYVGDSIYPTIPTHILGKSISLRYGANASYGLVLKENGNVLIGTTTDNGAKLQVNGGSRFYLNEQNLSSVMAYDALKTFSLLFADNNRFGLNVWLNSNGSVSFQSSYYNQFEQTFNLNLNPLGGNVLIGTATDSGNGAKLQVSGNLTATGDGVFGSDARYKSKLQDLAVDIETIANAPVFSYKWTDREDDNVHLGTTAQYWMDTKFKDAVNANNPDFYHLNYGALGVAIGVSLAKKAVNHEERIKALEEENKELKNEIKQLKQWHN